MLNLHKDLNAKSPASQEEKKEKKSFSFKQRVCSQSFSNKKLKSLLVTDYINTYLGLGRNQRGIISLLVSMSNRYPEGSLVPSQAWISQDVGCCLKTVNSSLSELSSLGIIDKRSRGWRKVDARSGIFKSNTCEYRVGDKLRKDLKFITKNLAMWHPEILKLIAAIPSLKFLIASFYVLTSCFLNSFNININNKYIRSNSITIFGQDNYEISRTTEKEENILTRIPSSYIPCEHPGNVEEEPYPYSKNNLIEIKKLNNRSDVNRYMAICNCTEETYKHLAYEDQQVASRYFVGKRRYGSVERYEEVLKRSGLYDKIWGVKEMKTFLSYEQIGIIKTFPEEVKQDVRDKLKIYPAFKNNFMWIYKNCMRSHKLRQMSTKELLKKHGFHYTHISEQQELDEQRAKYPYRPIESNKETQKKAAVKKDISVNEKFISIIGEEAYNAYVSRMEEH